jgi:SAM-dependent methyltransferase
MPSPEHNICPVCGGVLVAKDRPFDVLELFSLWEGVHFSPETIQEHSKQNTSTQLYSCPDCELGIFLPQIIGTSNFYADLIASEGYYSDDKWDFSEAINDAGKMNSAIEIGCGPGNFLSRLKQYVPEIYGTEYNESALKIAKDKGLKVFGLNDPDAVFLRHTCDIAFSFHVLEHVPDPVGFVTEMLSWVKPGGAIAVSVPNMNGPVKYIDPCVSNMPPHHASHWRLKTIAALAKRLNLKVERVAYEPLADGDQVYYSLYWANWAFPGNSFIAKLMRLLVVRSLAIFFAGLSKFGKYSTSLLRGQSIYVLLRKGN